MLEGQNQYQRLKLQFQSKPFFQTMSKTMFDETI